MVLVAGQIVWAQTVEHFPPSPSRESRPHPRGTLGRRDPVHRGDTALLVLGIPGFQGHRPRGGVRRDSGPTVGSLAASPGGLHRLLAEGRVLNYNMLVLTEIILIIYLSIKIVTTLLKLYKTLKRQPMQGINHFEYTNVGRQNHMRRPRSRRTNSYNAHNVPLLN